MNQIEHQMPANCYFADAVGKESPRWGDKREIDGVLLHFTAGSSAAGALATFQASPATLGYPVSVPYCIDRDGAVWKLHDESIGWGFHIGVSDPKYARNHAHDRRLIGIEIACIGPLWLGHDAKSLVWNNGKLVYGQLGDPKLPLVHLATSFRGVQYFVPFTQAQIATTVELVDVLRTRWNFPRIIPPFRRHIPGKAYQLDCRFALDLPYFDKFNGVASHVNFRQDKWDLAPGISDGIWDGLKSLGFAESE